MNFNNSKILITGGTGHLERNLFQKYLNHKPKKVIVFSR